MTEELTSKVEGSVRLLSPLEAYSCPGFPWYRVPLVLKARLSEGTGRLAEFYRRSARAHENPGTHRRKASPGGELLPLPIHFDSAEEQALIQAYDSWTSLSAEEEQNQVWKAAAVKAWLCLVVLGLNFLYCSRDPNKEDVGINVSPPTEVQQAALAHLEKLVELQLREPQVIPDVDWMRELNKVAVDYGGAEVKVASNMKLCQLVPGLPPQGYAGKIPALDIAEGAVKEALADPRKLLKPEAEWPKAFGQAKVWTETREDFLEIARHGLETGIFGIVRERDIPVRGGKKLLHGAFGVEKKNKFIEGGLPVLRLIINLIPLNEIQDTLEADIRTLPYAGQYGAIELID